MTQAVIPAASFSQSAFPASKALPPALFPILDADGLIVRTTMDQEAARRHAVPVLQLVQRAKSVVATQTPGDQLGMLCVRTVKHEMLICSERGGAFTILAIQNPNADVDVASLVQGAPAA